MFNLSDLLQRSTLIVSFVWTYVIVNGSLSYRLSVLRRIPSFWYFTTNFVIIIYSWIVFTISVKISLVLPLVSNFVPVSYVGDVEEHIPSKYCCALGGFKQMAHAELVRNVAMSLSATDYWVGHIYFSSVEHCHYDLMHSLQYTICLGVFDTGWLMLNALWIT